MVVMLAVHQLDDASEEFEGVDGFVLTYVSDLPGEILAFIRDRQSNYHMCRSYSAGEEYYATFCKCGGFHGDHYVQDHFFDLTIRRPDLVVVEQLPFAGPWNIACGYSYGGSIDFVLKDK